MSAILTVFYFANSWTIPLFHITISYNPALFQFPIFFILKFLQPEIAESLPF